MFMGSEGWSSFSVERPFDRRGFFSAFKPFSSSCSPELVSSFGVDGSTAAGVVVDDDVFSGFASSKLPMEENCR